MLLCLSNILVFSVSEAEAGAGVAAPHLCRDSVWAASPYLLLRRDEYSFRYIVLIYSIGKTML